MKKRILYLILAGAAWLLCSCGTTVPKQSGGKLFDSNMPKLGTTNLVIESVTNEAAALAEPYPTQILQIVRPAPEPEKILQARKGMESLELKLMSLKKDSVEYKSTLEEFQKANGRYKEMLYDWSAGQEPNKVIFTRMVGIGFKDSEGRVIEPCQNGKIIYPEERLDTLQPWYGGMKRTILPNTSLKDVEGCLLTIHSNDGSQAKRVYRLDGKGVMGEKWGTPYVYYNPQLHGERISAGNVRIYEVQAGSEKSKEINEWCHELILKAAIVAFKNDAIEALNHPKLVEFKGQAIDPMAKRHVERETSRSHAIFQYISDVTGQSLNSAGLYVAYNVLQDRGVTLGVSFFSGILFRLFHEREHYLFGSFGSKVDRIDWVISRLETEESLKKISGAPERNDIVTRYNDITSVCALESDAIKRENACKLMKDLAKEYRKKAGLPPLN